MLRNRSGLFCGLSVPSVSQMRILSFFNEITGYLRPRLLYAILYLVFPFQFFYDSNLYENIVNNKRKGNPRGNAV